MVWISDEVSDVVNPFEHHSICGHFAVDLPQRMCGVGFQMDLCNLVHGLLWIE